MNQTEIQEVLRKHSLWLKNEEGRERANLTGANLIGANLTGANLRGAYLIEANLTGAYLFGANLIEADLREANLTGAYLIEADLTGANLIGANLIGANLTGANLSGADLRGAFLRGAYLTGANLTGAYLIEADLRGANLTGADLTGAILPDFQIEQEKELIVYKKLRDGVIATLRIPAGVARTATPIGNKCRAAEAVVVEMEKNDVVMQDSYVGFSKHDPFFGYKKGKTVKPINPYNGDIREQCVSGIHFFKTREEAKVY